MTSPPDGYRVRPSTRDDLDEIAALVQAVDLHDEGVVEAVRPHVEDEWADPGFDAGRDTVVVLGADDALAAYAASWGIDPAVSVSAWINIHPDHRGHGLATWLLAWAESRARRSLPGGASSTLLRPTVSSGDGAAFLERHGYRHVRTFWHLDGPLTRDQDPRDVPIGVAIRTFDDDDGPSFHRILEEAFRDHFDFSERRYADWSEATVKAPSFDPSLAFLAERDGEPVGVLLAGVVEHESWVYELGVLPDHRGVGIGRALLRHAFAALASRGGTTVTLNVDGDNASGATRLYESVGMRPRRSWRWYEKAIVRG